MTVYKINPGGNITAIVRGTLAVSKKERVRVAKKILKKDPLIEQVGFWNSPKQENALARLEMMGGEFCGNSVRALAYLVWREYSLQERDFLIESSGWKEPIRVNVRENYSEFSLPLKNFSRSIKNNGELIRIPGICHFITNENINKRKARRILTLNNLLQEKAAGVISMKEISGEVSIKPVVWVRETETLYEETACASGTLAVAYLLFTKKGVNSLFVRQPSKSKFIVRFSDEKTVSLGGPIISVNRQAIESSF